jgi:dihydroxy-acid dehydratase
VNQPLRSERWFRAPGVGGLQHRAYLKSEGYPDSALHGGPVVGIANSWSELVNCNLHFRALAAAVKRGVLREGGLPLEFPTISLGEVFMKPTTMMFRNLMAMDVEESIRANPLDSVVLLVGCDKTMPAAIMGAASVDIPTIVVSGGPTEPAVFCGREIGSATDLWHYTDALRAGRMSESEYQELESSLVPTVGHCAEMGTASTMAGIFEAMGLALPGSSMIPAVYAQRYAAAEEAGRRAVKIAREGLRPSHILTEAAFENAIKFLAGVGGSTNAVIHLLALAGRVGVPLSLRRFDELAAEIPVIVNVRPSGEFLAKDLFHAGGIPAVLAELGSLLNRDAMTITGKTLGENVNGATVRNRDVIAPLSSPFAANGGIAVLFGNLAPDGAVIKQAAASPELMTHRGPALVFENIDHLASEIDSPDLPVTPASVLILKNAGPKGGPGMPEWGQLPIPKKLLRSGVTDMVRISDARMSGTSFGTVVLHTAPEAAVGGPLGLVQDGDMIELDVPARRLSAILPDGELERRARHSVVPRPQYRRGYGSLYLDHVLQAHLGCDFDFLRKLPDESFESEPLGWVGEAISGW